MNETAIGYTNKPTAEIPYSASRCYLPNTQVIEGVQFNTLPSGTKYVKMSDGSLRRVKGIQEMEDKSVRVHI